MQVLVVGSGPAGLMVGAALATRGHSVVSVDRDPGPTPQGWRRRGVMQFDHAHNFRPQVGQLLADEWPAAYDGWQERGAIEMDGGSGRGGMLSRRSTLERALWAAARRQPGLELRTGHVDHLLLEDGRVCGASVDGQRAVADLVVDASGRSSRVAVAGTSRSDARLDGDCGLAYIDRCYQLHPGSDPGPQNTPLGFIGEFDGYQCLVFLHERGHFSVVLVRPTADAALALLRVEAVFEAACAAIPVLAAWTDPARAVPTSGVMVGGALRNVYRSQVLLPGLVTVGDAVATTTPTRGRGVAMACMQIAALLRLLDDGADPVTVAAPFDSWCEQNIVPWVADHVAIDGGMVQRWQGHDIDLASPLTSNLIAEALPVEPRIGPYSGGYFAMTELPETLRPAEPLARAVYETGWRPPLEEGPSRDELVGIIERTTAVAAT
ncbi:FAD-dependent monooxygenase [Nocardioides coralli]|uniref:FAD-dependent monooxygenase n=1 Tax=Nocardioides coralli TaxID=2872154 RepID=UPI001CA3F6C0|nr:FAD-dependent monooxygenase [Nocardioides coralli]QZY28369.1 FAD-dependent monooxygenase [Nocardioides coralli]